MFFAHWPVIYLLPSLSLYITKRIYTTELITSWILKVSCTLLLINLLEYPHFPPAYNYQNVCYFLYSKSWWSFHEIIISTPSSECRRPNFSSGHHQSTTHIQLWSRNTSKELGSLAGSKNSGHFAISDNMQCGLLIPIVGSSSSIIHALQTINIRVPLWPFELA